MSQPLSMGRFCDKHVLLNKANAYSQCRYASKLACYHLHMDLFGLSPSPSFYKRAILTFIQKCRSCISKLEDTILVNYFPNLVHCSIMIKIEWFKLNRYLNIFTFGDNTFDILPTTNTDASLYYFKTMPFEATNNDVL